MLKYTISDLEQCWIHGFKAFHQEIDESTNPYRKGTKQAHYWREGWWEGFFNTDNLSDAYEESYGVTNIERIAC